MRQCVSKVFGFVYVIKVSEPIIFVFHGLYCVASQMFTPLSLHILYRSNNRFSTIKMLSCF